MSTRDRILQIISYELTTHVDNLSDDTDLMDLCPDIDIMEFIVEIEQQLNKRLSESELSGLDCTIRSLVDAFESRSSARNESDDER